MVNLGHERFAIYWILRNNGPRCIGSTVYAFLNANVCSKSSPHFTVSKALFVQKQIMFNQK